MRGLERRDNDPVVATMFNRRYEGDRTGEDDSMIRVHAGRHSREGGHEYDFLKAVTTDDADGQRACGMNKQCRI